MCPLPTIAAFANGISARAMSGSCLLGGAISVEAGSSLTISVCFVPGSIQRGAFFLTV